MGVRHFVWACASALFFAYASSTVCAQANGPLLLRDPTVSKTKIAFSYAGNIWIAERDGGNPRRLTSGGHDRKPLFSPDGSQIAFTADYTIARFNHGTIYVISTTGGRARRLTYHPADMCAVGWTPDGSRILFSSQRASFEASLVRSVVQLFTVPLEGGLATQVPLIRASEASYSPDEARIAYVPNIRWQPEWKHYRGGQTTPVWIANLADSAVGVTIPRDNSNDFNPMWVGDIIYFLSDRNGPVTLFSYDLKSRQVKQIVKNDGFDIKSAAASSDAIAYEQFGSLHLIDLKSGSDRALDIRPMVDLPEVRPHFWKLADFANVGPQVEDASVSPTGTRVALSVHGEILTVPAESGGIRNVTNTTDVVERNPAWSPDGHSIAYFSDESGEWALHVRGQDGRGVRKIYLGTPPTFYASPVWSPDSLKIAYIDRRLNVWYVDLRKQVPVRVDADLYMGIDTNTYNGSGNTLEPTWSPDSGWIAYAKQLRSFQHALFVYSIEGAKSFQLTDGTSDAIHAAFDKNGKCLYFLASTNTALSTAWFDMSAFERPVRYGIYAIALNEGGASLVTAEGDEGGQEEGEIKRHHGMELSNQDGKKTVKVRIDLKDIGRRIFGLSIPVRNYVGLTVGRPGMLYVLEGPPNGRDGQFSSPPLNVHRFDVNRRKIDQILDDVTAFHLSDNGGKMLYFKQNKWFIDAADKPLEGSAQPSTESQVKLDSIEIYVDPRAEWKHMYEQVWRGERDFFYDPGLHGLNLQAIKRKYEPYLENISTRDDLDYLFGEMLANMSVGHMAVFGPDVWKSKPENTGLLGADYSIENGRYRFARVYAGDSWNNELRGPLTQPTVNVRVGEYLLAVNGRDVHPPADVYSFFEGMAAKQVVLTVGPSADGRGSRDVTVVPVDSESPLRNYEWIEGNRHKVEEMTGGRVAYVYLPDTAARGYSNFNRYYFSQVGKEAVIIDERYNWGGYFADYIIDHLQRQRLNYFNLREGKDISTPQMAIFGPKAMIINEMSGSGGDLLPWMFRKAGIGPLIGKRTWGGLVGTTTNTATTTNPASLLDGGIATAPDVAFYNPNGTWDGENHGVSPDVDVEDDPKLEREGHDPQLESAIEVILKMLKANPPRPVPQHPPYPNYYKDE